MANDFIKINRTDTSATHAQKILTAVAQVRAAKTTLDEIIGIARHNFNDGVSPVDFSQFEALFGIPTGKGDEVFTFLDGTRGVLTGEFQNSNAISLIESVG